MLIAIIIVIIVIIVVIIIIVIIIIIIIVIVTTPSPCVTSRRLAVCRGRHRRHVGVISHACNNCAVKCVACCGFRAALPPVARRRARLVAALRTAGKNNKIKNRFLCEFNVM
jgi:hypothetical protein